MRPGRGAGGTAGRLPLAWYVYAGVTAVLAPVLHGLDARRMRRQGVPAARIAERRGAGGGPRPAGRLVWLNAVSVGEAVSVLALARLLGTAGPVLITTTTATAARTVAARLPAGCLHRFAPLDTPGAVGRFLAHWRPDLAVLVESELWPRTIVRTHARGTPLAVINARLSDRSLARWRRLVPLARALLSRLDLLLAQDRRTAEGLVALGADPAATEAVGTLKTAADPLPADPAALDAARSATLDRPVWLAASTHPGEEAAVLAAHLALRRTRPGLLLILVPRHPDRGAAIAAAVPAGLAVTRRAAGAAPGGDVYIADTLGELGLWYRLAPVAFVGGSLTDRGGHNPLEAVQLGCRAVTGPHVINFAEIYRDLAAEGSATAVPDAAALPGAIAGALNRAPLAPRDADDTLLRAVAGRLTALAERPRSVLPWPHPDAVDVIAPNFKRRLSGVTATVVRLVPLQARTIGIAAAGPVLPDGVPRLPLWRVVTMPRHGPSGRRVWHARRNVEMIAALALRHLLRKRLALVFTSASQRDHSALTRWLIARMDAVVATSDRTATYLRVPSVTIRHGIDTAAFAPAPDRAALRRRLGLPQDGPLIGCYGRIRAQKGTDVFVEGVAAYLARAPGTAIVMGRATGGHRAVLAALEARVAQGGLVGRIRFLPEVPVEAMADWYAALDLYVAPQRHEGFGLTPLEAMACGVPVVATRVGAFEELVVDGTTGTLIPPGDPDALRDAVAALLGDQDRLAAASAAARGHVARHFTLHGEADALTALYRRLLDA